MKKCSLCILAIATFTACSPSADDVKTDCLKNKENAIFYGEQTPSYCDCLYEKAKATEQTQKLTEAIIDSLKTACDAEFTTFDTNF